VLAHAAGVVLVELRRRALLGLQAGPVDRQPVDRGLELAQLVTPPGELARDVAVAEEVRVRLGDADGELAAGLDYARSWTRGLLGLGGIGANVLTAASGDGAERDEGRDR
jgi:hypothetical protein